MPDFGHSQDAILAITVAFLLAGLVKGVVGGGLPAVAVPIIAGAVEPAMMVTDTVSLTDMPPVFEALRTRTTQCKVMVKP